MMCAPSRMKRQVYSNLEKAKPADIPYHFHWIGERNLEVRRNIDSTARLALFALIKTIDYKFNCRQTVQNPFKPQDQLGIGVDWANLERHSFILDVGTKLIKSSLQEVLFLSPRSDNISKTTLT